LKRVASAQRSDSVLDRAVAELLYRPRVLASGRLGVAAAVAEQPDDTVGIGGAAADARKRLG